jgi:hypothetical protein
MSSRSTGQTAVIALGALLLVGGVVCVGVGFARFLSLDPLDDGAGAAMGLFAGGGLAMVVGLGIIAFTRVHAMSSDGRYTRVTIEQGQRAAQQSTDGPVERR